MTHLVDMTTFSPHGRGSSRKPHGWNGGVGTKKWISENGFPRQGQLCRNKKVRILKMASPGRGNCIRSGHSRGAWYGISDPGIPEEYGMVISYIRSLFPYPPISPHIPPRDMSKKTQKVKNLKIIRPTT